MMFPSQSQSCIGVMKKSSRTKILSSEAAPMPPATAPPSCSAALKRSRTKSPMQRSRSAATCSSPSRVAASKTKGRLRYLDKSCSKPCTRPACLGLRQFEARTTRNRPESPAPAPTSVPAAALMMIASRTTRRSDNNSPVRQARARRVVPALTLPAGLSITENTFSTRLSCSELLLVPSRCLLAAYLHPFSSRRIGVEPPSRMPTLRTPSTSTKISVSGTAPAASIAIRL
mmetsp:Transcript_41973/g.105515  ORF Transcript_41973/g.105515 Transcript_41973/m.105515 type:complete len:230 (+) Transcript_41973:308-997(+)